jgi:excisionase family DNA binding protein
LLVNAGRYIKDRFLPSARSEMNGNKIVGYTVKQVAGMLQISVNGALKMLDRGEIPGRRLGRLWRIPPAEFHAKFGQPVPFLESAVTSKAP